MPHDTHEIALSISDLSLSFGGLLALNRINLNIRDGEILAVIGPNGAGMRWLS
jgi:ABC-type branched-subunit amino acid transport system ATPase component